MVKTKNGISISYETGYGPNHDLPCVVFQRGADVVSVVVKDRPYGHDVRFLSADRGGLLRELGPILSQPELLNTSLDMIAGALDCPHHEPLHYHHDGCPAGCDDVELLQGYDTELRGTHEAI